MVPVKKIIGIVIVALFCVLLVVALLAIGYGFFRTWKTGRSDKYEKFVQGTLPAQMPEGPWTGYVDELTGVSWKGKKFLGDGKGINVFENNGVKSEAYQFAFFQTEGVDVPKVVRLDYGQKGNPLWLRFIVDEMVSVGDNRFLGIVYIDLIPGIPFRMGYFRLEK